MKRIVGYARESTMDQAHNGFNMDDQERRIKEFCSFEYYQDPYELSVRREEGCSGKDLERPEIQKILQQAEENEIDIVVIYCLDRLTRSLTDLYDLLERFKRCNVSLVSITDRIDTGTLMGRFFVSIIVLIAQWELDTLSSRTERGIQESIKQGNYAKGRIPLGYKRREDDPHLIEVREDTSVIIRRIFTEIAADRESCYTLAKKMKSERLLGRAWTEKNIKTMVKNRLYYGCLQSKDTVNDEYIEPIVARELWERANDVVDHKKYVRKTYFYDDKICCSCCRIPMGHVCTTKGNTGKTYLYYRCPKCKGTISEENISESILGTMDYISKVTHCSNELELLKERHTVTKNEINRLTYSVVHHGIDRSYAGAEAARLRAKELELSDQIERIAEATKVHYYDCLDREEQKELLEDYVERIDVTFTGRECRVIYSDAMNKIMEGKD